MKTKRKKREIHPFHEYMGHIIWRNDEPGHRLRWSCLGIGAADTLAGMKSLIRHNHKRKDIAYKP